jgi:lysozyme family protein
VTDRKPVFDAFRAFMGGTLTQPETDALDAFLDKFRPTKVPADPFDAALTEILKHEGGFVNHPSDPGGMTNLGVTKGTYESWTGKVASEADMRALTKEKVAPIYRKNYWNQLLCDQLPAGLALCVFDFGVNAGPARAARYLQSLVGAKTDGKVGLETIGAVGAYVGLHGEAEAIRQYQSRRRDYYKQLPTFKTFGRGWLRRVDEVEATALGMAK